MHDIFEKFPKCFYVFIGEENAEDMEGISETVEVISKFFGRTRPTSIVVMGKFSSSEIKHFSIYFSNYTMVKYIEVFSSESRKAIFCLSV